MNGNKNKKIIISVIGIRPAISLKLGIEFTSGDGTATNPYVVKYN